MDSEDKPFLNRKRAGDNKPKIELPKEESVNIQQIINNAFDSFIKGNNDNFFCNYELLEKYKSSKYNIINI